VELWEHPVQESAAVGDSTLSQYSSYPEGAHPVAEVMAERQQCRYGRVNPFLLLLVP